MFVVCAFCASLAVAAEDAAVGRFLLASGEGKCIESVTFLMIREFGPGEAGGIVRSALTALARREDEQRALGCSGDIAAQAIAAGADPAVVLAATAAGLK